jgi:methyl-accepting chemotaxis protein
MTEIVKSIAHVASIMTDITLASREQSQGIEQVNITVSLMDEITQKNATLVEEAAAASESLRDQSDMLINLVNAFKIVT